jgi:hypothetical protein
MLKRASEDREYKCQSTYCHHLSQFLKNVSSLNKKEKSVFRLLKKTSDKKIALKYPRKKYGSTFFQTNGFV